MRQTVRDIAANKGIFFMLFIGFLFTILPTQIAISTQQYYDEQFYHSKNGFFKYYYSVQLTNIQSVGLDKLQEIAQAAYEQSNVITSDMSTLIPKLGYAKVTGLLNDKLWSPPLIDGAALQPDDSASVIAGKLFSNTTGTLTLFDRQYQVKGVAGLNMGNEYNLNVYVFLREMPEALKHQIENQNAIQLIVRSNRNPENEINRFMSQMKQFNPEVNAKVTNEGPNYKKEKNTRDSVKEILSYPYKLVLIALINCINVSYLWIFLKKKEISLRKALGAGNLNLLQYIVSQLFICASAAAICSIIILWLLNRLSANIYNLTYYYVGLNMNSVAISILITVAIAFATSVIPLIHIMKIEPAKALKE